MKKIFVSIISILLCATFFISCGSKALKDDYGCFVDYEEAVKYSQKKKLPLLVFFTSEGDDEQSTQIVSSIFRNSSFSDEILKNYAVFHADFSQEVFAKTNVQEGADKAVQEIANTYTNILQKNYQLAMLLNVSNMPAVFLCTKDGFVVERLDDQLELDSIAELNQALSQTQEKLGKFNDMVVLTNKGSAADKVEAIDTIYMATSAEYRTFLLPLVLKVPQLDKDNKTGLTGKYVFATAQAVALSALSQGDVETAVKKYLEAADNSFLKDEEKQECFYTAAYIAATSGSDDYEGILTYLQTAYDLAPNSDKAAAIKDAVNYFGTIIDNIDEIN